MWYWISKFIISLKFKCMILDIPIGCIKPIVLSDDQFILFEISKKKKVKVSDDLINF